MGSVAQRQAHSPYGFNYKNRDVCLWAFNEGLQSYSNSSLGIDSKVSIRGMHEMMALAPAAMWKSHVAERLTLTWNG